MHLRLAAVFCFALVLTWFVQWRGNAYRAEFSGDSDEPAHYVTGLMVHDYLAHGLPGSPMAYATRFYDFYPKVAIGHWPPVFYVIQAAWTLLFGISRNSLMVLMAMLGAAWLTLSYVLVRRSFPEWAAIASVVLLASASDFQAAARSVMAELPVAIFTLIALGFLARCLDGPDRLGDVGWFSLAALATVLTKGTGIALAPMPLLGAAAGRKWRALRSAWFWLFPLLAAGSAAVWFLLAPDALQDKVSRFGGFGAIRWIRTGETFGHWGDQIGLAVSAFAVLGYARKAWSVAAGRKTSGWWIVAVVFLPVTLACRLLFGPWHTRHLLTTLPLLVLFLWDGVEWMLEKFPRQRSLAAVAIVAAIAATAAVHIVTMHAKPHLGIDRVVSDLLSAPEDAHSRLAIVSDALGEGVFIAEVARHEQRPGHVIERGTKIFADESFMSDRVRLFFRTPAEMLAFLEKVPDRILVVDGVSGVQVLDQVRAMIQAYPNRWRLLGSYPRAGANQPLRVYRLNE